MGDKVFPAWSIDGLVDPYSLYTLEVLAWSIPEHQVGEPENKRFAFMALLVIDGSVGINAHARLSAEVCVFDLGYALSVSFVN